MNNCSFFIKDKALFGSSPSQKSVEELEENGVKYFIDLTTPEEKEQNKVKFYITKYNYINYPIIDRHIPTDWRNYASFIIKICKIIKKIPYYFNNYLIVEDYDFIDVRQLNNNIIEKLNIDIKDLDVDVDETTSEKKIKEYLLFKYRNENILYLGSIL